MKMTLKLAQNITLKVVYQLESALENPNLEEMYIIPM